MSAWAKDQVELLNLLFEIGWEDPASGSRALSIQPGETRSCGADCWLHTSAAKSPIEGPWPLRAWGSPRHSLPQGCRYAAIVGRSDSPATKTAAIRQAGGYPRLAAFRIKGEGVEKINAIAELLFTQFEGYMFSARGQDNLYMVSVAFLGRMDRPMTLRGLLVLTLV